MTYLDRLLNDHEHLKRATQGLAVLVIGVFLAFAAFYYWDRYVRLGDQSVIERQIATLEAAIREDPQDPTRRVALAEYYLGKGMYPQAVDQAEQVLRAYPENEGALLVAGIAYNQMGKHEQVIEPLGKFVELRKDSPMAKTDMALETAYYFLGESYLELGQPEQAIPALEAAIAIERTDADALYKLGQAYLAVDDPQKAVEYLQRAVRLVPDFAEAYTALIDAYTALDQPDYVSYARGMLAYSQQDYVTARTHLEQATQTLSDFLPAWVGLGLTYEQLGQIEQAMSAIERALQLDPNDLLAQQTYGRLHTVLQTQPTPQNQ